MKNIEKPEQKQKQSEIMLGKWKKVSSSAAYRAFIEAILSCRKTSNVIEACKVIASSVLQNTMTIYYELSLICLQVSKCQLRKR